MSDVAPLGQWGYLHRTPLFMRNAGLGLYFYRVPSLPATDDGSAKPLAEDLSTRLGSEEDITWDAGAEPGATEADVAVSATEPDAKARPAQAVPETPAIDRAARSTS